MRNSSKQQQGFYENSHLFRLKKKKNEKINKYYAAGIQEVPI